MSAVDDALQAVDESWAGYSEAETLAQEFRWACDDLVKASVELEHLRGLLDTQDGQVRGLMAELAKARARIDELEAGEVRPEWGVRWDDDEDEGIEQDEDAAREGDGGEKYARRLVKNYPAGAHLVRREVRTGPWTTATPENPS